MPLYKFQNDKGEIITKYMSYEEYEQFKLNNQQWKPVLSTPAIVSGVNTARRLSSDFKDRLKEIKKNYPNSSIKDY